MRREQFTLEVLDVDWIDGDGEPTLPTLSVTVVDDETETLDRYREPDDGQSASDVDVTVRLSDSAEEQNANAVVAVTDRVTGEYVIEGNADATAILSFVTAARRYGERTDDTARYRVEVLDEAGSSIFSHEKRTLLVYSRDGELLRGHSLIPSGVEI